MLNIDRDIIPRLERTLLKRAGDDIERNRQVTDLMIQLRAAYGGRELPTSQAFMRFQYELGALQLPSQISAEIRRGLDNGRADIAVLLDRYPDVHHAVQAATDIELLGPHAPRRAGGNVDLHRRRLLKIAREYFQMMSVTSPLALAARLVELGIIQPVDRQILAGLLGSLLGTCAPTGAGPGPGFLNYDPEILAHGTIHDSALKVLTVAAYKALKQQNIDTFEGRDRLFPRIAHEIEATLYAYAREGGVRNPGKHDPLFAEVIDFYKNIVRLGSEEIPQLQCFVDRIQDRAGVWHPFPSLRQLIATERMVQGDRDRNNLYVCYHPGDGKTAIAFLSHSIRNARHRSQGKAEEQLLYVLPTITVGDISNRVRPQNFGFAPHQYYVEGRAPETGIIRSGLRQPFRQLEFDSAFEKPIIFCPPTMFNQVHRGSSIFEHLNNRRPGFVVIDESGHLSNGGNRYSKWFRQLFQNANARMQMSGTPTAYGGLSGFRVALELHEDVDPQRVSIDTVLRNDITYDPPEPNIVSDFHARITNRALALDEPRDFSQNRRYQPIDLFPEQEAIITRIINDTSLTFVRKFYRCLLAERSPWLWNTTNRSAYLEQARTFLDHALQRNPVALITEASVKKGIMIPHPDFPGPTFAQKLADIAREFGSELHCIYGGVPQEERLRIYDRARESIQRGRRMTIFAMSACLNLGIELPFIEEILRMGPSFRMSWLDQELCRTLRAGHNTPMQNVLYGRGTIEAAELQLSMVNFGDETRGVFGGIMSERRMAELQQSREEAIRSGRLRYGLESTEDEVRRWEQQLHSSGSRYVTRFWQAQETDWRNYAIQEVDRSGSGDQQRLIASLVATLDQQQILPEGPIVHINTSGMSLARHLPRIDHNFGRQIIDIEPVGFMHIHGRNSIVAGTSPPQHLVGNALQIPKFLQEGSLQPQAASCVVLEDLHQLRWSLQGGNQVLFQERLQALRNARLIGQNLLIPIPFDACSQVEFQRLCRKVLPACGWQVNNRFTGTAPSLDNLAQQEYSGEPPSLHYIVLASSAGNSIPSRSDISSRLSPRDLLFSPRNRRQIRQEISSRRLPYQFIHTIFALNGNQFRYDFSLPARDTQVQHLSDLENAVRNVKKLAPTTEDWNRLSQQQKDSLQIHGIQTHGGVRAPGFVLSQYPDYTLYPYDAKWNSNI